MRWGNYDMSLVMSGEVFAAARFRPSIRATPRGALDLDPADGLLDMVGCMFQLPDTPEVRRLAGPAGAEIIPGPTQTTNSWGCRGPEPNTDAPVRGIVLGDSFMQGYLVGDDQTPPEQLGSHARPSSGRRFRS